MKKRNVIKEKKYHTEEQEEIIRFIKILLIVLVFIVAIYFATKLVVKKDTIKTEEETKVTINYDKTIFGSLLNRPYNEYYAIAFASSDKKAGEYTVLSEKYKAKTDGLFLYYIDLDDSLNAEFVSKDGIANTKASSLEEIKAGNINLIKIKDGKIVEYLDDFAKIKSKLN